MADLTPEESNQWFGGQSPTNAEVEAQVAAARADPFGFWWDSLTGNKKTVTGRATAASGGGLNPLRSGNEGQALAGGLQLARDVRNAPEMDAIYRQGAMAPDRVNPYSTAIADQSRQGQLALIQQMRAGLDGPSLAGMQGQRAFGQSGQQALMQGGRAGMLQAQQIGGGLAGDLGQARLAEVMRGQGSIGGAAGNLRGGDLRSSGVQLDAGLRQRAQDEAMRQFYAAQGANLNNARMNAGNNREAVRLSLLAANNKRDVDAGMNFANQAASTWGGAATAAGGKK